LTSPDDLVGVYSNWQPARGKFQEWQQKGDIATKKKEAETVVLLYLFGN
jgi:hypothetical protein